MKKAPSFILLVCTALVLIGTISFYIWNNMGSGSLHVRALTTADSTDWTGPAPQDPTNMPDWGLVNINTADLAKLTTLPGIGEVLAQRIIDYREAHGPFDSPAGLLNVDGIGKGKLEAILDLITTGGTT